MTHRTFYEKVIKRILDVVISSAGMLLFSWLYAIVALLVRFFLGKPVIFSQERPGRNDPKTGKEKPFRLYKFRSMKDLKDKSGKELPDDARLTKFGRVLRSTSLDELPEVWNIFKGDMSLVGPRPLLMEYLPYYTEREHHRHDVRPGLTGLAQVNGRTAVSWQKKFDYDLEYVEKCSFLLDVKILLQTVIKTLKRVKDCLFRVSLPVIHGIPVRHFPDLSAGFEAAGKTLKFSVYPAIRSSLLPGVIRQKHPRQNPCAPSAAAICSREGSNAFAPTPAAMPGITRTGF